MAARQYARIFGQLPKPWDWAGPNSHVREFAPIPTPKPTPTAHGADIPRGNKNAAVAKPVPPSPAPSSALTQPGPVKPASPVPACGVVRGTTNTAIAKAVSPSPGASPAPALSEPFTAYWSESASPPSQELSDLREIQGPPLSRVCIPKSERNQGASPNKCCALGGCGHGAPRTVAGIPDA